MRRAEEESRRQSEEEEIKKELKRIAEEEEKRRVEEETRRAEEESRRKSEEEKKKRAEEEKIRAEEEETKRSQEDEKKTTEEAKNQFVEEESILSREFSLESEEEENENIGEDLSQDITHKEEINRKTNDTSKISIGFGVQYDTSWGQNLVLVGSSPSLGNWDPAHGQRMTWLSGNYWKSEVEFAESSLIEYKYVVVLVDVDRFVDIQRWEERNNRFCDLTQIIDSNQTNHPEFWNSWNF